MINDESTIMKHVFNVFKVAFKFIIICLIIAIMILFLIATGEEEQREKEKIKSNAYEQGYIDACKDFYKGKTKYDLIQNDDGTKTWQKVK